jgi:peroxiredoxin
MKAKFFFYILLYILVLTSCGNDKSYLLEGNISGLTNSAVYLVTSLDSGTRVDTVLSKNGKFTFVSSYDSVKPVIVYLEEGNVWVTVWVQNGETIKIEGAANHPELIEATGNEVDDLLTEFKRNNKDTIRERSSLGDKDHSKKSDLEQTLVRNAGSFIEKHPASVASLVLIQDYLMENEDIEVLGHYLSLIESPAKEDRLFTRLNAVYHRLQQTSAGNPAPDFSVVNVKGDTLTLESFKDRYLLLAFENSTCGACKEDYPVLKKIYKEYHKKDLDILGIVFDEDCLMWKNVAKEYDITWLQVIDKYGWASPLLTLYNVNTIPDYFFIGKDGKIIASHASINDVQQLIKENVK